MTTRRRRVVVSTLASDDEAQILTTIIERAGVGAARKLLARFARARRSLTELADRGRVVPELDVREISAFRELQVPPYRLVYRVGGVEVRIVALVDARRDLTDLLLERARR